MSANAVTPGALREQPTEAAPARPLPTGEAAAWPPAVADLYRQYYKPLVQLAFLLTGADPAAEEIVQDCFVAIRQRIDGLANPGGYLRAAVVNRCANHRRRLEVERRHLHREIPRGSDPEPDHLADALRALPPRQRAVIVLRYYEGLTEAEIAEVLGCRPGTVKSAAARGLAALRGAIER